MPKTPIHYVAVGASAGGLEAIEAFFKTMPTHTGLAFIVVQQELKSCGEQGASSPLVDEELTSVKQMFVLKLKDGRPAKHQIPGAAEESDVKEVDLKTVLPPIANYDAIAFQKVFAELRQLHQKPQEVAP